MPHYYVRFIRGDNTVAVALLDARNEVEVFDFAQDQIEAKGALAYPEEWISKVFAEEGVKIWMIEVREPFERGEPITWLPF